MTAQQNKQPKKSDETTEVVDQKITCGIIMPIATMSPEYTAEHWEDVRAIIDTAIERAGFLPRIVSDSEDSTIIHKSIINNIYKDEIIVCDVSNKNANVMFELGMRLAFNKPVVIIKDDKTGYSFDTSNIEHVGYRKDLRHNTIEKFISDLTRKIKATYEAPKKEGYQPFLSHFGEFEIAKIENRSIGGGEALEKLLNKMTGIELRLNHLDNRPSNSQSMYLTTNKMAFELSNDIPDISMRNIKQRILEEVPDVDKILTTIDNTRIIVSFKKPIGPLAKVSIEQSINDILSSILENQGS